MGLAQRLREGSKTLHTQAERAGVMASLLRGQLPLMGFVAMQRNLHRLYAALEPALAQHATHPVLAPLQQPGLARAEALAADLAHLHGAQWAGNLPVQAVATAYADRLAELSQRQPALLAAHAYVRYLGDLSGGQPLGRVVRQAYGLASGPGSLFFDFGPPAQVATMVRQMRLALDQLPLDEAGIAAQVQEAQWAFAQHVLLFEALAAA